MARLEIEIGLAGNEMNRTIRAIERLNERLSASEKSTQLFGNTIDQQRARLRTYNSVLQTLLQSGLPTWNRHVQQLKTEIDKLSVSLGHQADMASQQAPLDRLAVKLTQIANDQNLVRNTTARLNAELKANQTAINGLIAQGVDPADTRIRQLQTTVTGLTQALQANAAASARAGFLQQFQQSGQIIPDLEQKIRNLNAALNQATDPRRIVQLNIRLREAQRELDRVRNLGLRAGNAVSSGMNQATTATQRLVAASRQKSSTFSGITSQVRGLVSAYVSLYAAINVAQRAFRVAMETDAIETSMTFILNNSDLAASKLEMLRKTAGRLGLEYVSLAGTYRSFIGATEASNFNMEQAEYIFNAVANAGAKLKLSGDQVRGTFLAIEQMISKGTVSMEELRRQLGDRLPGSFAMAARAMGMTEIEFNKLVSTGQVLSRDLLPKLADELNRVYGNNPEERIISLQASVNRLSNEFSDLVEKSNVKGFFQGVVDAARAAMSSVTGLVTAIRGLDSAIDPGKVQELTIEYGLLAAKGLSRTSEETNRLKAVMQELGSMFPGAVERWGEHGEILNVNISRVQQLTEEHRKLMEQARAKDLGKLRSEFDKTRGHAEAYQNTLNRMLDNGGWSAASLAQVESDFAKMRLRAMETARAIQEAFGYEALTLPERTILQMFGLDQAGEAMRAWDALQKQVSEGAEPPPKRDPKAEAEAKRVADAIMQSEQRLALARATGDETEIQRIRNWYESRMQMAKGFATELATLERNMQEEIRIAEEKAAAEATSTGVKRLSDRRKQLAENAAKILQQNRKFDAKEAQDALVSLTLQRRLFESRTQIALRELNTEYKGREDLINENLRKEIEATGKRVEAEAAAQAKIMALQEEYYKRREELETLQREINTQTAFDGDAFSVPLARINDQVAELKRSFEAGTISVEQFRAKIAELSMERESLGLMQNTVDGIAGAFGNLYADAIFNTEDAMKNLGKTFENLAKNIISGLIKIAVRYAINQAIGTASMTTTAATSSATAATITSAWATAAALVSAATFGANVAAGGAALSAFMASTKALSMFMRGGYKRGGYTGNVGVNEVAGIVHGQEFVVNARATKQYLPLLTAINSGTRISSSAGAVAASALRTEGAAPITVHVVGEISGENIKLAVDRASRSFGRFYGQ